eukprot:1152261-Pelagomonas_calceolata.AAC.4
MRVCRHMYKRYIQVGSPSAFFHTQDQEHRAQALGSAGIALEGDLQAQHFVDKLIAVLWAFQAYTSFVHKQLRNINRSRTI